ncbi:MAG: hypothetical protein K9G26_02945 [Emcibacter sp.]|nr:hypothetical protein [Emcibacter sp.]
MIYSILLISLWANLFLMQGTAFAYQLVNKLENLVMPGDLSQPHAKYEKNCTECHSPLNKELQDSLCLKCHEKVGLDITKKQGFHGRNNKVSSSECKTCHTDHEGRNADILGFNQEIFNHDMTDFPLTGKHAAASCHLCHQDQKKFREAKTDCFSCHEKDDSHKGDMGKDCSSCHDSSLWKTVKFDHAKTKFPLKGHHEKVACKSCHPDTRYKQTPMECIACHGSNDNHEGRFGQKCATCHSEKDWKTVKFDHGTDAKFLLKGKHQEIDCEACHRTTTPKAKVSKNCNDCHVTIDIHKGRNGLECQKCHNETDWKKTEFSHDKDTKFILKGAHKDVTCFSCHRGPEKHLDKARICFDCHKSDDVHKGQLGTACETCHNEKSWGKKVRFDHELTMFPLIGLHAIATCDDCHTTHQYKDAKTICFSCHEEDDVHKQTLGKDCAACHNPNGWSFWQFDHNAQTKYKLEGSHEGLVCSACHKMPKESKMQLSQDCVSCHEKDDAHHGRFGTSCNRCHITESFKKIRIGR